MQSLDKLGAFLENQVFQNDKNEKSHWEKLFLYFNSLKRKSFSTMFMWKIDFQNQTFTIFENSAQNLCVNYEKWDQKLNLHFILNAKTEIQILNWF